MLASRQFCAVFAYNSLMIICPSGAVRGHVPEGPSTKKAARGVCDHDRKRRTLIWVRNHGSGVDDLLNEAEGAWKVIARAELRKSGLYVFCITTAI